MQLETSRLLLREFVPEDAPQVYELNKDPEVLQYTGDAPFESIAAAGLFLKNYSDYQKYGYGRWAVLLKQTNEFVGWCGLKYFADTKETDLGYRLKKAFWNRGIATEAARICLQYGFEQLNLPVISAHAMKANTASIKVMEKLGMQYWKDFMLGEHLIVFYKIEKPI